MILREYSFLSLPSLKLYHMSLIKSISGIRGTIGGITNENLTPVDIVKFTAAYGTWILGLNTRKNGTANKKIIIGRDGRIKRLDMPTHF